MPRSSSHPPRRRSQGLRLLAAATLICCGCALGDPVGAVAALTVSTSASPTFSITLNGQDRTGTYTLPLDLIDSTGSGAGWNLTITSTQFATGAPSETLPASASSITGVTSVCTVGPCTTPTNSITYPVGVPAGATPPSALKFFDAAVGTGAGEFTVTPTVSVSVPANSYAGTYTSTLTASVISGP